MNRAARALVLGLATGLLFGACGAGETPAPSLASPVDGVVVAVDAGAGLGNVRGFTLRLTGGATIKLILGTLENPTQFGPGHLAEHEATGTPIRVYFVAGDAGLAVYRLEDAPPPSSSP